MTKNNLRVHLGWLLDQGPSLYPSLKPPSGDSEVRRIPRRSATSNQANFRGVSTEILGDDQLVGLSDIEDILDERALDAVPSHDDSDMARLSLASQSISKPRMLFQSEKALLQTPNRTKHASEGAPATARSSQRRNDAKGTNHSTS